MIRHGPHRLPAQAYQLRLTILLAVRIRSTAPLIKIRHDGTRLHCKINRQARTYAINAPLPATVSAPRLPHQNPKSP
jgi:hypothetical protein